MQLQILSAFDWAECKLARFEPQTDDLVEIYANKHEYASYQLYLDANLKCLFLAHTSRLLAILLEHFPLTFP